MTFDLNKDMFQEEAQELLDTLEKSLLELEKNTQKLSLVNDVFRALHTIKGSGAMFGFEHVAQFTHHVENLFDEIRKGHLLINPDIINIGLRATDTIAKLLQNDSHSQEEANLLEAISAYTKSTHTAFIEPVQTPSQSNNPQSSSDSKTSLSPQTEALHVYRITIIPDRFILHRGVKLEALFLELKDLGDYHCTVNLDAIPDIQSLEPTEVFLTWVINLASTASEASVRAVFIFVEDYAQIDIQKLELEQVQGEALVPKVGELLVSRGAIEPEEVSAIVEQQKAFGDLAVKSGKVKPGELVAALVEQRQLKNASLDKEHRQESSSIRVRKEKLDFLVDAVGELVILQARLHQEAKKSGLGNFEGISESLARLTASLRDTTMSIRMVPLEESFTSFQRLVRDLAKQLKKDLYLEVHGASTELDKNIIESLKDPLVHIIRNSADHGIETGETRVKQGKPKTGTISISAEQVGSKVEIEIRDDGAGLDLAKIKARGLERKLIDAAETDENKIMALIFEPGFSTAAQTTGVSGRGVGMDVVKTNIEKLRGSINISSSLGKGTSIVLSIPLTLVIVDGLLVKVAGVDYVIALNLVRECVDYQQSELDDSQHNKIIHLRGKTIPVIDVYYGLTGQVSLNKADSRLVITKQEGAEVAFKVDAVLGKQQVVIKPFTATLKKIPAISGATILGDGAVALILNTNELVKSALMESERLNRPQGGSR